MKREFLQLAQQPKYGIERHKIGSEKLDGERCFWDGGISRGMLKAEVPWANTAKDSRFKLVQYSTGLWTRYGNPIFAPDSWLDRLPNIPLDGEIYAGRNNRQRLISIVRKQVPSIWEWKEVSYKVFDVPPLDIVFRTGIIDTPHYFKYIKPDVLDWVHEREEVSIDPSMTFLDRLELAKEFESKSMQVVPHVEYQSTEDVYRTLNQLTKEGAEGMILHRNTEYQCCRTHDMVKLKELDDAEAEVTGYVTGRETDKGSKLLGLMGAMKVRMENGVEFELSGFTNAERALSHTKWAEGYDENEPKRWAEINPETLVPLEYEATHFPRGCRITFQYRGMSTNNVPNEARYWRKDNRII